MPRPGGRLPRPNSVEIIETSNLDDSERRAAVQVNTIPAAGPFTVPAYSVVRVIWPAEVDAAR